VVAQWWGAGPESGVLLVAFSRDPKPSKRWCLARCRLVTRAAKSVATLPVWDS
jgi:hypothetical protein